MMMSDFVYNLNLKRKGNMSMNNFYLGCDVSKGYADFIILDSEKGIIESPFQLDDTFEGHCCLYELLDRFFKIHPDTNLYAAVESTGGLENNWLNLFHKLAEIFNIRAARVNPSAIKALYDASLTRNINDGISAQIIAEYLITYPEKVSYNTDDPYVTLRKQWNYIEILKKQRTQLLNQLSVHLYTALPFLVKYCKNSVPNWLLKLLLYYPSAKKLAKANESSLCKIPYISHKRALNIIFDAQNSIGSADDQVTVFLIKSLVKQILNLKKTVESQENYMIEHCNLPEVKLLMSFRGIGIISAIGLILNIISISRFPTAKHLASYFGVHPVYKQSGDGSWGFHMSKKGRSTPRAILFMIAWSGINSNPLIKEVYIDHIKRGKSKMAALGVCMHKILRIVYGMLKSNKSFDPQIDKRNKNRTRQQADKNESEKKDIKRRFQGRDKDAPISRRQSVKRKKRKESQSL
jgi:transposase